MDARVKFERMDAALLLLRLVLGGVFLAHGVQKVFGWLGGPGLEGFVAFVTSQGMPSLAAYGVAYGETAAGLGLIFGLLTRIAAAGMCVEMLGATLIVHWSNGFFMNWAGEAGRGEGFEYPLTLAIATLAVTVAGAGAYSLDAMLASTEPDEQVMPRYAPTEHLDVADEVRKHSA